MSTKTMKRKPLPRRKQAELHAAAKEHMGKTDDPVAQAAMELGAILVSKGLNAAELIEVALLTASSVRATLINSSNNQEQMVNCQLSLLQRLRAVIYSDQES
jgi:hypothetical protein